jgi:hypothetical protein
MQILVVYAIVVFVLFVALARLAPQPPARRRVRFRSGPVSKLVGGLLWSVFGMPWRVSSPFALFQGYEEGIRIGPNSRWLAWLVPTWDLQWSEIAEATEYTGGIRVRPKESRRALKFLTWPTSGRKELAVYLVEQLQLTNAKDGLESGGKGE